MSFRDFIVYDFGRIIPDSVWIQARALQNGRGILNLSNPHTLDEKIQWLKLHDHSSLYTMMADKVAVKNYIKEKLGEEYVIPMYGHWNNAADIDFSKLPDKYVLKCNHNSGEGMFLHQQGEIFNEDEVRKKLNRALSHNYFYASREWAYKNIHPQILCEQLIENADCSPLVDYKFYCYGGEPRYFMYSLGEAYGHAKNHKLDMNCRSIDSKFKEIPAIPFEEVYLPYNIDQMIDIVRKLCKGFQFIRVDLYNIDGHIYFGEFTFYSNGGFLNIRDEKYKQSLADMIDLSKIETTKN